MELPKNITQIGEANHRCKIYVEDYVISYMKQLNHMAEDKDMAVALYGIQRDENDVSYLFLYGACKLNFLQRETRHLSQAQQQEIERCRERYFRNYTFLGYRLLNGEMIEGFHVCEQGICRYIPGYAQFYEKNDSMLAYMLDVREEKQPEVVEQEKYEIVKKRQEERRALQEEKGFCNQIPQNNGNSSGSLRGMRVAVVAVFALLCMVGVSSMNGEEMDLQAMAKQVLSQVLEQQIPDAVAEDTLIAEDKLAEAILQENEAIPTETLSEVSVPQQEPEAVAVQGAAEISPQSVESATMVEPQPVVEPESVVEKEPIAEEPIVEAEPITENVIPTEPQPVVNSEPVSYIIKEGDTLIGISMQKYGSEIKVTEICSLNQIENPDDIKVGQKILLP